MRNKKRRLKDLPECMVQIKRRKARTAWERLVRAVVGEPVHVDVVISQRGTPSGKFCYSSYMNQKFEMLIMKRDMVYDQYMMDDLAIEVTSEECKRCSEFLSKLVDHASYNWVDALLLMPLAPKKDGEKGSSSSSSTLLDIFAEDVAQGTDPSKIKKIFCSQSVVLMLRYALDPNGKHAELVRALDSINSRLVSPKQVCNMLKKHCKTYELTKEEVASLAGLDPEKVEEDEEDDKEDEEGAVGEWIGKRG